MIRTADKPTRATVPKSFCQRQQLTQTLAGFHHDRYLGKNGVATSICSIRQPAAGPAWHGFFGAWSMRERRPVET